MHTYRQKWLSLILSFTPLQIPIYCCYRLSQNLVAVAPMRLLKSQLSSGTSEPTMLSRMPSYWRNLSLKEFAFFSRWEDSF